MARRDRVTGLEQSGLLRVCEPCGIEPFGITKHVNYSRWQDDGEVERGGIVVAEVMIEDLQLVCGMPSEPSLERSSGQRCA
ncbi:hypothetical protein [Rhizobium redzepovicii]|uniref:hypothetical protein n=1 Tax=Rhizobium redzepovicii TaxID=2867518 RepID=UPI0035C699F2